MKKNNQQHECLLNDLAEIRIKNDNKPSHYAYHMISRSKRTFWSKTAAQIVVSEVGDNAQSHTQQTEAITKKKKRNETCRSLTYSHALTSLLPFSRSVWCGEFWLLSNAHKYLIKQHLACAHDFKTAIFSSSSSTLLLSAKIERSLMPWLLLLLLWWRVYFFLHLV